MQLANNGTIGDSGGSGDVAGGEINWELSIRKYEAMVNLWEGLFRAWFSSAYRPAFPI